MQIMKAREFADYIAAIGFVVGSLICTVGHGEIIYLGIALASGSVYWYFKRGQYLTGWIGQDFGTLLAEYNRLSALTQQWKQPDGTSVPMKQRDKILIRRDELFRELAGHPEREKHKDWKA